MGFHVGKSTIRPMDPVMGFRFQESNAEWRQEIENLRQPDELGQVSPSLPWKKLNHRRTVKM